MSKKAAYAERLGNEDFASREALQARVRELQSAGCSVRKRGRPELHGSCVRGTVSRVGS
jgi:hypothetical protein